jgi:hypothetical protein
MQSIPNLQACLGHLHQRMAVLERRFGLSVPAEEDGDAGEAEEYRSATSSGVRGGVHDYFDHQSNISSLDTAHNMGVLSEILHRFYVRLDRDDDTGIEGFKLEFELQLALLEVWPRLRTQVISQNLLRSSPRPRPRNYNKFRACLSRLTRYVNLHLHDRTKTVSQIKSEIGGLLNQVRSFRSRAELDDWYQQNRLEIDLE